VSDALVSRSAEPIEVVPKDPDAIRPEETESVPSNVQRFEEPNAVIDDDRLAAERIRRLDGEYLTLLTDLPPSEPVDTLVDVFDAAYPLWCEYFGVAADPMWRMFACVISDRERFERAGLLPGTVRDFREGFSQGHWLWLYDQPTDYYRRHLMLHEGTHGFMTTRLGGMGPHWYMEGMAELLGTHRWHDGALELGHFPADRGEVPLLGRIKLVQDAVAEDRSRTLQDVLNIGPSRVVSNDPYAWCWALCALMDGHPRYRDTFRQLGSLVTSDDFNARVRAQYGDDFGQLATEWPVFAASLEHAHDIEATAIDFGPAEPLVGKTVLNVDTARGWQNSGIHLNAGQPIRFEANGRYQVAESESETGESATWMSEPGGVTIRYYRGEPLGILLAAIVPDDRDFAASPTPRVGELLRPLVVGLGRDWTPELSGALHLRVNDSAGELGDNNGELTVAVDFAGHRAD
jgi:hypothetical protein